MNSTPASWLLLALAIESFAIAAEPEKTADALAPLRAHVAQHRDGAVAWSLDFSKLEGDRSQLPIGVFDSGIGGLTVMEAILRLDAFNNRTLQPGPDGVPDFAGERFIYFGDQANMPYGNYPARGREDYLHELIVKDAVFLLGTRHRAKDGAIRKKPPVKAIVIACNTATAYGLADIRAALTEWGLDVPVIGVVEAGARAVTGSLPAQGEPGAVAVLATVGTCQAKAYPKAIERAGGLAGLVLPPVLQQGSVGLAGAIEGNPSFVGGAPGKVGSEARYLGPAVGRAEAPIDPALASVYGFDPAGLAGDPADPGTWRLTSAANYVRYEVATLVESYRRQGGGPPIATVVLGCTHFPIVAGEIANAFARLRDYRSPEGAQPYRALIADRLFLADPAKFTAQELFRELARGRLRADPASALEPVLDRAFVSVPHGAWPGVKLAPDGSFDAAFQYGRLPGKPGDEDTWVLPLEDSPAAVGAVSALSGVLPKVWAALSTPPKASR